MRLLYVGSLEPHGTCFHRMRALRELGHEVFAVAPRAGDGVLARRVAPLIARADLKLLNLRVDLQSLNKRIRRAVLLWGEPEVVWFDKPLTVRVSTVRRLRRRCPAAVLVAYSPDDQLNAANHSRRYLAALRLYDIVFTTKSFNVPELKAFGAREVVLAGVGFDPATHRPVKLTQREREAFGCDVSFVGTYERERAECLRRLAADGVRLKVWGNGWRRMRRPGPLACAIQGSAVYGDDYARVICASKINLAFLRTQMRDRITTRSVEIPACGGFMLAQRTREHLEHFAEDREAVYFSTYEELRQKVWRYLEDDEARGCIARAGRARCLSNGYANHDRLRKMLEHVHLVRAHLASSASAATQARSDAGRCPLAESE